jgi:hypothetical protein
MEKIDKLEMSENKKVLNIFEQSYITEAVEHNTNAPVGTN